jgi:hypothetical protein
MPPAREPSPSPVFCPSRQGRWSEEESDGSSAPLREEESGWSGGAQGELREGHGGSGEPWSFIGHPDEGSSQQAFVESAQSGEWSGEWNLHSLTSEMPAFVKAAQSGELSPGNIAGTGHASHP